MIVLRLNENERMQDFITSQLYHAEQWAQALKEGFAHDSSVREDYTVLLRASLESGMKSESEEIARIAEQCEEPTFANTIVALARAGVDLERATTVMYNLLSAETSDGLDDLANEMASRLTAHGNAIMQNEKLFLRVKAVHDNPPADLTEEDRMLLRKTYEGFERSGATLDEEGKRAFRSITEKLSERTLKFSQNLLKETNAYILHLTEESDLAGLPELHREAAAHEARERGLEGWVFTLHAPSFIPFMTYSSRRDLRQQLYEAYHTRCTADSPTCNFPVVTDIVNLRRELAQLLGYSHYADYALQRRMASTPQAVEHLLDELKKYYLPQAREEVERVCQRAQKEMGADFSLMPWDFAYYSQKLKEELYAYDPDMLRPYFELSRVKQGIFSLATTLYGITFEPDRDVPVYHPDVEAYRVYDEGHQYLAMLFLDFFPRKGKQGGAWMTGYRDEQCDGPSSERVTSANSVRPVVSVTTNFTKPSADKPSLLTLGEVETFLHEFGHALHGIFAMTHYASLSGTSVYWDFVELPSQFMENYAVEPAFLQTFARHYRTGASLPSEYIDRVRAVRNFQVAYACMRQVSFGELDMAYYTLRDPFTSDVRSFEAKAWADTQLLPVLPNACMTVQFGHIMSGGYAAGYYSYKWAEVLDADAFSLFKERGIFDRTTAQRFRDCILSRGGTEPPLALYERFRGRKPTLEALLRRDGIECEGNHATL